MICKHSTTIVRNIYYRNTEVCTSARENKEVTLLRIQEGRRKVRRERGAAMKLYTITLLWG